MCTSESFAYVQAPCLIPTAQMKTRLLYGLVGGCIAVFLFLYSTVYFDYIKTVQTNLFVDFDVKTITAGDYTIEFDIDKETYEHWQAHYLDKDNYLSESAQFKLYIQNELETICSEMPNQGYEPDAKEVKIAQITMAYDNALIIKKLQQRGMLIKREKWADVKKKN